MVPDDYAVRDGVTARYDTRVAFDAVSSWEAFDIATIDSRAKGFFGGLFDGRYVYFAPFDNGTGNDGFAPRFDTTVPGLSTLAAWSFFDTQTLATNAKGFYGMAFDGTYVYYVPNGSGSGPPRNGMATRYDSRLPYTAAGSWSTFDLTTVDPNAKGFFTAAFDGTYLYFVPCFTDTGFGGVVARYDTRLAFTAAASWSVFDLTSANPLAKGYAGSAFDGRYIYFAPRFGGLVVRYDSQAPFANAASWTTYDLATLTGNALGFSGMAYDGRSVYFVPDTSASQISTTIVRFDTTAAEFAVPSGWSLLDLATVAASAGGFVGAAFDGRYLYLAPYVGKVTFRFDVRDDKVLPPHLGSFL